MWSRSRSRDPCWISAAFLSHLTGLFFSLHRRVPSFGRFSGSAFENFISDAFFFAFFLLLVWLMSNTHREPRCTCDVFSSAYVGSSAQHRHCGTESNLRSQEAAAALELDPAHVNGSSTAELTVKFFFLFSPNFQRTFFISCNKTDKCQQPSARLFGLLFVFPCYAEWFKSSNLPVRLSLKQDLRGTSKPRRHEHTGRLVVTLL